MAQPLLAVCFCRPQRGQPSHVRLQKPHSEPSALRVKSRCATQVITWLHAAKRDVLNVHPRSDPSHPLTGEFATRSPDRPNPLGLRRVTIRKVSKHRPRISPSRRSTALRLWISNPYFAALQIRRTVNFASKRR
ncbi:MAG TPA: TrmO family methyltransferase [Verrucomicrobiae bacterium]|nr:TrmO family methyltransferase [Verrucomicrobiae bacterium]